LDTVENPPGPLFKGEKITFLLEKGVRGIFSMT